MSSTPSLQQILSSNKRHHIKQYRYSYVNLKRYKKINCMLLAFGVLILCYFLLSTLIPINFQIDSINLIPTILSLPSNNTLTNPTQFNASTYLYFTNDIYDEDSIFCGRLWLYKHHNILLSITNKGEFTDPSNHIYLNKYEENWVNRIEYTIETVIIEDINNMNMNINFNCSDLTIFVRISGPETLGGLAKIGYNNSKQRCYWYFKFKITIPGNYSIIARVIYYKGHLDFDNNQCDLHENVGWKSSISNMTDLEIYNDPELFDDILISTRIDWRIQFYDRHYSCCEWCSRLRFEICKYWMSGPGGKRRNDRCNMFYDDNSKYNTDKMNYIKQINMSMEGKNLPQWFAGKRREEETTWYLGSKLSVTPSQRRCFIGNWANYDMIYNSNFSFIVYPDSDNRKYDENLKIFSNKHYQWILQQIYDKSVLPYCSLDDIQNSFNLMGGDIVRFGRWVTSKYYININNNNNNNNDCIGGKKYFDEYMENDTLSSNYLCLIISYHYMWHKTYRRWPSNIWVPYSCKYQWFNSIQDAIDLIIQRGVKKIYWTGDSVPRDMQTMLFKMAPNQMMDGAEKSMCKQDESKYNKNIIHKLQFCYNRGMTQFVPKAKPQIIVNNNNLLHQLWHYNMSYIEKNLDKELRKHNLWISQIYGGRPGDGNIWPMKFFMNAPLILAEREYHVTGPRAVEINKIVMKLCKKHNWFILPYFDLSESQMYDSTREGMHPEGPVLMELIRLFFHMIVQYTN